MMLMVPGTVGPRVPIDATKGVTGADSTKGQPGGNAAVRTGPGGRSLGSWCAGSRVGSEQGSPRKEDVGELEFRLLSCPRTEEAVEKGKEVGGGGEKAGHKSLRCGKWMVLS